MTQMTADGREGITPSKEGMDDTEQGRGPQMTQISGPQMTQLSQRGKGTDEDRGWKKTRRGSMAMAKRDLGSRRA
jgi:hypothetical protein